VATLQRLRQLGVSLSIDDFGTGYSSLAQLKRCPIRVLKIDRSFVTDVTDEHSDAKIAEAIVVLSHKFGIDVLAEGVETAEQLARLHACGCDAIQGYLLSPPVAASAVPGLIAMLRDRSDAGMRSTGT
jgi:EAL domain-containing protein (putative c-di-GMP-specific phosphodiesterase class I)